MSMTNQAVGRSSPSPAIVLKDVSVRYRVPTEPVATLKEYAIRLLQGRRVSYREFWALKGIDLEVTVGEAVGVIGRNGAGKSTLLKVVSRILRPTEGRVWVRGKVAPLIELGAGFHPELTGRENVYLNGAMLGFSRDQMEEKFERIVDFAELWDFIDAPLRMYSSGMQMRLGFAIASDVDPDILIIDEILAVGDEDFQEKCTDRMREFRQRGTTLLFVSHAMNSIRQLCTRAVLIDSGRKVIDGAPEEVIDHYHRGEPGPEPIAA
jgi:ABC-type polysaccharide/polyol phosphate transport system ATPase subunit